VITEEQKILEMLVIIKFKNVSYMFCKMLIKICKTILSAFCIGMKHSVFEVRTSITYKCLKTKC